MPKIISGPNGENLYPVTILIPASLYEKLYQGAKNTEVLFNEYVYQILNNAVNTDNSAHNSKEDAKDGVK